MCLCAIRSLEPKFACFYLICWSHGNPVNPQEGSQKERLAKESIPHGCVKGNKAGVPSSSRTSASRTRFLVAAKSPKMRILRGIWNNSEGEAILHYKTVTYEDKVGNIMRKTNPGRANTRPPEVGGNRGFHRRKEENSESGGSS
jgi:hypothetical protein